MIVVKKPPPEVLEKIRDEIMAETDSAFRQIFAPIKTAKEIAKIAFSPIKKNSLIKVRDKLDALKTGAEYAGMKPAEKHQHDISGFLMAAVAAHLSERKNDPTRKD